MIYIKRKILYALSLNKLLSALGNNTDLRFLTFFAKSLGADEFQIGIISAVRELSLFTQLPWGRLSDYFMKRKIFVVVGGIVFSIYLLSLSMVPGVNYLIFLVLILSLFFSMEMPSMQALLADLTHGGERGKIFGVIGTLESVGSIISFVVIGLLLDLYSFHILFLLCSAQGLLGVFIFALGVEEPKVRTDDKSQLITLRSILYDKRFIIITLSRSLQGIAISLAQVVLPKFVMEILKISMIEYSITLIPMYTIMMISALPCGVLMDRIGRKPILIVGFLLDALCHFLFPFSRGFFDLLLIRALLGVMATTVLNGVAIVLSDISSRRERGQYISLSSTLQGAARMIGLIVGGALANYVGFLNIFFIAAVIDLIATLSLLFLKETLKKD